MSMKSEDERETAEHMEAESDGDQLHRLGEGREAAVAAIAESLARTAAGAMNSKELATAGDVDFSKLGEEQKAEVTETFANAIQRESAPRDKHPLPTLLDEVLRQDFIREPSPDEEPAEDSSETEASGAHKDSHEKAEDERFAPKWGAPEIALQAPASRQPVPQVRSEPSSSRASETLAPQEKAPVRDSRQHRSQNRSGPQHQDRRWKQQSGICCGLSWSSGWTNICLESLKARSAKRSQRAGFYLKQKNNGEQLLHADGPAALAVAGRELFF